MIKSIDEARDILYDMVTDEDYENGATNVFTFYYDELEGGNIFQTVMYFKQALKKDLLFTAKQNSIGKATDKELEDLKVMFNILFS